MRRFVLPLLLVLTQPAFAAEPIEGNWLTPKGAVVSIASCGDVFCLSTADGRQLGEVSGSGGTYEGRVTNPETGKSNAARIDVAGDTLTLSGCIGLICASREWARQ